MMSNVIETWLDSRLVKEVAWSYFYRTIISVSHVNFVFLFCFKEMHHYVVII